MKVDKRGRVRFTHNGCRVELTGNSVRTYRRHYKWGNRETASVFMWTLWDVLSTAAGRAKMEEALRVLREHENSNGWYAKARTVNTIIPKHMRAVN